MARAAAEAPETLGGLLGMRVEPEWPSEDLLEMLPDLADTLELDPALAPWGLYLVADRAGTTLIGDVGFKGPPDESGSVEIGYGIVSTQRRRGYATEAVQALVGWASTQPSVRRVEAICLAHNQPSARVLARAGFQLARASATHLDWELRLA